MTLRSFRRVSLAFALLALLALGVFVALAPAGLVRAAGAGNPSPTAALPPLPPPPTSAASPRPTTAPTTSPAPSPAPSPTASVKPPPPPPPPPVASVRPPPPPASPVASGQPSRARGTFTAQPVWSRSFPEARARAVAEKRPLLVVVVDTAAALVEEKKPIPTNLPRYATGTPAYDLDVQARAVQKELDEIQTQLKGAGKKGGPDRKPLQDRQKALREKGKDLKNQIRKVKQSTLDPKWNDNGSLVLDVLSSAEVAAGLGDCLAVLAEVRATTEEPAASLKVTKLPTYILFKPDGTEHLRAEGDTFRPDFVLRMLEDLRTGGAGGGGT